MMFIRVLMILSALLVSFPLLASPLPRANPEDVGLSSERLARITTSLNADIKAGRLPGAVVAVARRGKLVYFEAVGTRNKAEMVPMTKDTIFSIASMTKPMVSVAIMILFEEGRLMMTDPISKYFPGLSERRVAVLDTDMSGNSIVKSTVPARRQPTIQDLLRHTSGLTYGNVGDTAVHKMYPWSSAAAATEKTGADFIEQLGKLPLLYHPGTVWEYSLSFDVLGLVVEAITGKTLGQFLAERLWNPLGMMDTGFALTAEKRGRYAVALPPGPETDGPQFVLHATGKPIKFDCGGGCAISTAGDYLHFAQMLLNGGRLNGKRILSRKTVEYMTAQQLDEDTEKLFFRSHSSHAGHGFGLGVAVRLQTGVSITLGSAGDYEWSGLYGTYFFVDPKEDLAAVFMAHTPGQKRLFYRHWFKTLVEQAIID